MGGTCKSETSASDIEKLLLVQKKEAQRQLFGHEDAHLTQKLHVRKKLTQNVESHEKTID